MIQIPEKLKPENFIIKPLAQNDNNKIINTPIKMPLNHYTITEIRNLFYIEYKTMFKREFQITEDSNYLLSTILCYFFKDIHFFNSPYLIIPKGTTPSFDKGLLVIGDFGIGKTSILLTLEQVFNKYINYNPQLHFKAITANELVIEYEKIKTAEEKEDFYNKYRRGFKFFDDVKKEDYASNFGKVNLFEKILFLRDLNRSKTIITCNYDSSYPSNFEKGLDEFGTRYGGHIYDRLLGNFNFIQGGGNSLRG